MKINFKKQLFYLALAAICLVSVSGAVIYYFYALNWLGISLVLILSGLGVWYFARLLFVQKKETFGTDDIAEKFIIKKTEIDWKKITITSAWLVPYFIFLLFTFYFLLKVRTDAALTSPWQVVSVKFFIFYILATAYLLWLIIRNSKFTLWLIMAHYFLSFSALWIVFKIGYGYDPFIHQATADLIDKQGAVFPKTPYYLGQYALILFAHKLFFLPIVWADKLLVPLLAALALPPTIYLFLKKRCSNLSFVICNLSLLILLILPFSVFTLTVPQNLAYLFLLLSIFFSLFARERIEIILSFLLAGAALATHPIAGIPALLFALAALIARQPGNRIFFTPKNNSEDGEICLDKPREGILRIKTIKISEKKHWHFSFRTISDFFLGKNIFYVLIALLTAVVLPLLFYLSGKNSTGSTGGESTAAGFIMPGIAFPRQENIFLNFIYFFLSNEWLVLIVLALAAGYAIYRYRDKFPELVLLGSIAISLLVAYFITKQLNFNFLISYERNDYAQRILFAAFIFLIPVLAILAGKLIELILSARPLLKYSWLALLVILIAVSLYGSYPRLDRYFNSRGFSVGADDLAAVNWIAQDAGNTPYVVLADQQVSVGALWTFGFSHYYKSPLLPKDGVSSPPSQGGVGGGSAGGGSEIYFYPIPTGGPLYQIYLNMVYQKPDRATALQASDLTGASTVYFIINKYWTDFDKIVEQAKIEAGSFQNINNGQIYIFKYTK
ncbi:MAG: hypothetical protein PHE24_02215 [Patescibacteria group bacterium]|nr:hypothetical protein [Patescibacteria group bacterium]